MSRIILIVLLVFVAGSLWAANLQVTEFRDVEIDLVDPISGEYLKTVESKNIAVPLPIEKELDNGTYLVSINGEKVCLDSGAVKTNKVYNIDNIQDCSNTVKTNYVAASRGLGKGCLE